MNETNRNEYAEPVNTVLKVWDDLHRRVLYEKQWFMNFAYTMGYQWLRWDEFNETFYEPPSPSWRVRLTDNQIIPFVRTKVAKILKNKPQAYVIPNTTEEEDKSAAQLGEKVLRSLDRKLKLGHVRRNIVTGFTIMGNYYGKVYWNPNIGTSIKDSERGVDTHTGEVQVDACSPFEIVSDQTVTDWEKKRWVLHITVQTLDAVKSMFPEEAKELKAEQGILQNSNISYENKMRTLVGRIGYEEAMESPQKDDDSDCVILKEYWEKPSTKHPKGRRIAVAGGDHTLLHDGPMGTPMDGDEPMWPFVKFWDFAVPGRDNDDCTINHLIPLQIQWNRHESQMIENKNMMGRPKWTCPHDVGLSKSAITSEPGEIIFYHARYHGQKPDQINVKPLPNYVVGFVDKLVQSFQNISGQHEVSKGQVPPGVESGIAIQYLQEQDDTQLGPTIEAYEDGWGEINRKMLILAAKHYKENRVAKIVGRYREAEVVAFKGQDLKNNFDVYVKTGSAMPTTKAARQQFIMNLWDRGLIVNRDGQPDPRMAMNYLEIGGPEEYYEDVNIDQKQQEVEILKLQAGKPAQVHEWDNHQAHIDTLEEHMKKVDWDNLSEQEQMTLLEHRGVHKQMQQEAMMAQMQQQQQMMAQQQGGQMGQGQGGQPQPQGGPQQPMPQPAGMGAGPQLSMG
jgi:hypothetical protein